MSANPASGALLKVLDGLGGGGGGVGMPDRSAPTPDIPEPFVSALCDYEDRIRAADDPDELATLVHALWQTKAAISLVADEAEAKLARLVGRKLDTARWHLETKTSSAKVSWDHDLARSRIEAHARETGEQPLDLLYRVASVGYYRQGVLTAEGIKADGLKRSEPGRTRVIITARGDTG